MASVQGYELLCLQVESGRRGRVLTCELVNGRIYTEPVHWKEENWIESLHNPLA